MRRLGVILLSFVLLISCREAGVKYFWDSHSIDYSDIDAAHDQFVDYAALASAADTSAALVSMDRLFDKLKEDEVAYYIYTEWVEGIFYHPFSPYRSEALYARAVERMGTDGIFSEDECVPYRQRLGWMRLNRLGGPATVPDVALDGRRTLVLVFDLGCPSCREALQTLAAEPRWAEVRRVAIGCGYGPEPEIPGWEYVRPEHFRQYFDQRVAPFWFVVSADGTVETSYSNIEF